MNGALYLITSGIIPFILTGAVAYGAARKMDVFSVFTQGAAYGIKILMRIFPMLTGLLCAIYMLRASGLFDYMSHWLAPLAAAAGIPADCIPLVLLRPFSGGGSLALAADIIRRSGPNSFGGRLAAVMLASSETTFYTAAVYFSAAGIKKSRYTIPAALTADFTAFVVSAIAVKLFF